MHEKHEPLLQAQSPAPNDPLHDEQMSHHPYSEADFNMTRKLANFRIDLRNPHNLHLDRFINAKAVYDWS